MTYQTQPQCFLGGTPEELFRAWCVVEYQVYFAPVPETMLITAVKLSEAFTFAEAQRNSEWRKWVTDQHTVLTTIRGVGTREECQRKSTDIIMGMPTRPRCNLYGYNAFAQIRPLECSNGKVYQTQAEAAQDTGTAQSAISRHLKGELKQVKGLIFRYKDA